MIFLTDWIGLKKADRSIALGKSIACYLLSVGFSLSPTGEMIEMSANVQAYAYLRSFLV